MDLATVTAIRAELESALVGSRFGKVFQMSRSDLVIDLRLAGSKYLFVSSQPGNPRTYLIERRLRDLEKTSINPGPYALVLRKRLSGAAVTSVTQLPAERVIMIDLLAEDEFGKRAGYSLAIQLTGKSANVFLVNGDGVIVDSLKPARGDGQQTGDKYAPPERAGVGPVSRPTERAGVEPVSDTTQSPKRTSLSESLDAQDRERTAAERFKSLATSARAKLKREISKRTRLVEKLQSDRAGHGDADRWKRFGDLLLANVSTARRDGERVFLIDYFDASAPEIEIAIEENESLTDAAERYFKKYTKARNAGKEIDDRLKQTRRELADLGAESEKLETAIASGDEDRLRETAGIAPAPDQTKKRKRVETVSGVRTFVSSDGFEILVGKKAKDNDFLTFRIARSLDTWMHAADYPGSHVVIRNQNRMDVPPRTLLEAAQLAAFYSQGKSQPKAAVHYTQKKFVNKPKGAAPGLVSLASFKTLLVEPKVGEATLKTN